MSIAQNLSWEDYQQVKRMNPSTLVAGCKSMLRLKRAIAGGMYEESGPMRVGTGVHALLLEPDEFESRFVVMPDFHLDEANVTKEGKRSETRATAYYKEKVAEFAKQTNGKSILSRSESDECLMCIESIHSRPAMSKLIAESSHEVTVYGEIEGVEFKGRIDALTSDAIVDLKTTADVSPLVFGKRFFNLGYDFKLSIYRDLIRQNMEGVNDVKVIAQEPSGDFDNCLHPIYPEVLDAAFQRVLGVVRRYKECLETNVWPGVDGGQDEIDLWVPSYVIDDSIQFSDSPEEVAAAQEFASPF
jgi:hypothetical protein